MLQDRKIHCLQARPCIFQPKKLQAGETKGLTVSLLPEDGVYSENVLMFCIASLK